MTSTSKNLSESAGMGASEQDQSHAHQESVEAQQKPSDLSRAFAEDGMLKTHVGGQALIEGIMMRGKYNWSVAVRTPDGDIYVEEHDLASGKDKNGWMYWPLIRGCRAMVESLTLGFKALEIAMVHAFGLEDESDGKEKKLEKEELEACVLDDRFENEFEEPIIEEVVDQAETAEAKTSQTDEFLKASDSQTKSHVLCGVPTKDADEFSWKEDFGRLDVVIDGLGAQHTLEVVSEGFTDKAAAENGAKNLDVSQDTKAEGEGAKKSFLDEEVEISKSEMGISMVLGVVLGVVLFIVAPAFITNLIVGEYDTNPIVWNIVDGVLRVGVFVLYLWLIGRMEDMRRMFGYHGAEHKTIHCYEHGLPLTPENARSFPRLHVRCGTAFLIMVMIIAIFVYTIIPVNALISAWGVPEGAPKLLLVIAIRIIFLPVIAGLSYEITVKWAGAHPDNPLVKVVLWPGMQMQYLTTNEPDDGQIECAIAAMKRVLEREEAEACKTQ